MPNQTQELEPFVQRDGEDYLPKEIACGGWGQTVGGQVVGGLLARAIEELADDTLQPARLTVDLLRRVALRPLRFKAEIVRSGSRMQSVDAQVIQDDQVVARASALFLRRGEQPADDVWSTPIVMPPIPDEPPSWASARPMFIQPYGKKVEAGSKDFEWQYHGPKFAWVREIRALVQGEEISPFVRAAMAVDVTSSLANFGPSGLKYINADYTLTLCRLPDGPFIGLAALTHFSSDGVATSTAAMFDRLGPIGSGVSTAIANPNFHVPDYEGEKS